MKKIILATVLAGIGSTAAIAADLGARTYTKAPMMAPVSNWTGFYIGADAGYAFNGSSSGALTNSVGVGAVPYDANLKADWAAASSDITIRCSNS